MRARFAGAIAFAVAGVLASGCNGLIDPSKNKIETFDGTIPVQGQDHKAFSTNNNGEYSIKVVSLTPQTNVFVGVILAAGPSDDSCSGASIIATNGFTSNNTVALSGAMYSGHYCVFMYDVGQFTQPENYEITVSHP